MNATIRDLGAEIQPTGQVERLFDEAKSLIVEINNTEESLSARRLRLGQVLVKARRAFPSRGPKAAGWGKFLEELKIGQDTALNYMKLAGYVEANEEISRNVRETGELPTYRQAGIIKQTEPRQYCEVEFPDITSNETEARKKDPALGGAQRDYDGDEWYTPPETLELVRGVLGEIDLDPASCEVAQQTVGAKRFFSKEALRKCVSRWYELSTAPIAGIVCH